MLGEFEYLLITAAAGLGDAGYGAAIREEIAATSDGLDDAGLGHERPVDSQLGIELAGVVSGFDRLEKQPRSAAWLANSVARLRP